MNWYGAKTPASVCPRCIATAKPWRRRGCSIGPPPCPTASPAMNMPMTRRCTMPSAFPATVFSRWMWIWRKDTGSTWTRNTALKWRSRRWKSTDTAANAGLPEKQRSIRGKWNYYNGIIIMIKRISRGLPNDHHLAVLFLGHPLSQNLTD